MDGVLAPSLRRPGLLTLPWEGWSGSALYDPKVVEELLRLVEAYGVSVEWLSSWQEEANPCWSRLGLGPYPYHVDRGAGDRWWKSLVVENELRRGSRPVFWVDDELEKHLSGRWGTVAWDPQAYQDRLWWHAPRAEIGLTLADLLLLEAALTGARRPSVGRISLATQGSGEEAGRLNSGLTGIEDPCS